MLTLTKDALTVVRTFSDNPRLEPTSGVRIAEQPATPNLQVRAVGEPQPDDLVVEQSGGRLYLQPQAARRVRGKVLDVRRDARGRVEFLLKAA